jgi:hypothetical protein
MCKHRTLLKGNYNTMLTTQNITSKTPQGSYHMKYTNLCNEKKKQTINTKVFNYKTKPQITKLK